MFDDSNQGDPEDAFYVKDGSGRFLRLDTNHIVQVIDALERLPVELEHTKSDLTAWKWAIIYAHTAAQNAMANLVQREAREPWGTDLRRLEAGISSATSEAERMPLIEEHKRRLIDSVRRGDPAWRVLDFLKIWEKVKEVHHVLAGDEDLLKRLDFERGGWLHFGRDVGYVDLRDYPKLVLAGLRIVDLLGWKANLMIWHIVEQEDKERALRALDECLRLAGELEADYAV